MSTRDTKCRQVSIYHGNCHSADLGYLEEIEDWVLSMAGMYSNHGLPAIAGIGHHTTDYAKDPELWLAISHDDPAAGWMWWGGTRAVMWADSPTPPEAVTFSHTVDTTATLTVDQLSVTYDAIQAAVEQFVVTGGRPTCVDWVAEPFPTVSEM
jgi:hypothetical protein